MVEIEDSGDDIEKDRWIKIREIVRSNIQKLGIGELREEDEE